MSIGVGLSVTSVGVGGRAAVHSTQQGAQVAHRHLLDEGGPILSEIPPLKDLKKEQTQTLILNKAFNNNKKTFLLN